MTKQGRTNFRSALSHDVAFHAGRIECKADHDYLNAAAVVMSVLNVVRNYAEHKALTAADLDAAIEAATKSLDVVEKTDAMGSTYYAKKSSNVPQPLGPALADGGPGDLRVK